LRRNFFHQYFLINFLLIVYYLSGLILDFFGGKEKTPFASFPAAFGLANPYILVLQRRQSFLETFRKVFSNE